MTGRGEMEAAKHRLALPKKWAAFANGEAVDAAQREHQEAQAEEKEAEAFLKKLEERWEVVDVDSDGGAAPPKAATGDDGKGNGEIDAAKQRLSLAKKWAASATGDLEVVQSRLRNVRLEQKEAEKFLKGVEERLGVIDVDVEGAAELGGKAAPAKLKCEDSARKRQRTVPSLPSNESNSGLACEVPSRQQLVEIVPDTLDQRAILLAYHGLMQQSRGTMPAPFGGDHQFFPNAHSNNQNATLNCGGSIVDRQMQAAPVSQFAPNIPSNQHAPMQNAPVQNAPIQNALKRNAPMIGGGNVGGLFGMHPVEFMTSMNANRNSFATNVVPMMPQPMPLPMHLPLLPFPQNQQYQGAANSVLQTSHFGNGSSSVARNNFPWQGPPQNWNQHW